MKNNKYFIAIYTNEVKDYCDEQFFNQIKSIRQDNPVHIVDNTLSNGYFKRLQRITKGWVSGLYKIGVPEHPKRTQFLRNVAESVESLRDLFIDSEADHFLIIESDVIPPEDVIYRFNHSIFEIELKQRAENEGYDKIKKPLWGIIGSHYYHGFHDMDKKELYKTNHALSGCTVYNGDLVKKYKFRWSEENLGAFPDAWICYDSGKEFDIYNDGRIVCEHLMAENGTRQSKHL